MEQYGMIAEEYRGYTVEGTLKTLEEIDTAKDKVMMILALPSMVKNAVKTTKDFTNGVPFDTSIGFAAGNDGKRQVNQKIRIEGNKNIFTNNSGKEIIWTNQTPKDIEMIINSKLNSSDMGDILEGKVATAAKEVVEVKGIGLKLLDTSKSPAGDLDIVTDDYIIEVKASLAAVKEKQIPKYTDPLHPNYVNSDNKKIIYFIEDTTTKVPTAAKKLQKIKEANAIVVTTLEDLKEILKNG